MRERENPTQNCFFLKITKIDKHFTQLTKKRREKIQFINIRNERGAITEDSTDIEKDHKEIL